MTDTPEKYLPLGRMFSYLTKQYIGQVTKRMENTPVSRYYFPLYIIGKNCGKISQKQLAEQLMMDKVSLVRILDNLTADGLIRREPNPDDRRQHLLFVTQKAEPWIGEVEKALRETDQHFLDYLDGSQNDFKESLKELVSKSSALQSESVEIFYKRTNSK